MSHILRKVEVEGGLDSFVASSPIASDRDYRWRTLSKVNLGKYGTFRRSIVSGLILTNGFLPR